MYHKQSTDKQESKTTYLIFYRSMVTATYFYIKCKADELCFFIAKVKEKKTFLYIDFAKSEEETPKSGLKNRKDTSLVSIVKFEMRLLY